MIPLAHTAVLKNYLNVSQQFNFNPYYLLSNAGLNPAQLNDPKQRIPVDKAIALLEQSAEMSGCEVFGLLMAEQRQIADFGELSLLLSYQQTLRDALKTIVRYRNIINNALEIYIEEEEKKLALELASQAEKIKSLDVSKRKPLLQKRSYFNSGKTDGTYENLLLLYEASNTSLYEYLEALAKDDPYLQLLINMHQQAEMSLNDYADTLR